MSEHTDPGTGQRHTGGGATEQALQHAQQRATRGISPQAVGVPRRQLVVVSCMDSRIDLGDLFGISVGDAHLLRNAGGVVTDDVIRSIALSQRKLGTIEVMLLHHTGCGMTTVTEDGFKAELERETGERPGWSVESFSDPFADVRQSMQRLRRSPFLPHRDRVRGFVYDVDTGKVLEVTD